MTNPDLFICNLQIPSGILRGFFSEQGPTRIPLMWASASPGETSRLFPESEMVPSASLIISGSLIPWSLAIIVAEMSFC